MFLTLGYLMYEVSTDEPSTRKCWYLAVSNCYSAKKVKQFFEGSPTLEQKRLRSDNSTALDFFWTSYFRLLFYLFEGALVTLSKIFRPLQNETF